MMQRRRHSIAEAVVNTAVGFILSNLMWPAVQVWILREPYHAGQGLAVISAFTLLSVARNYATRRLFNRRAPDWAAIASNQAMTPIEISRKRRQVWP